MGGSLSLLKQWSPTFLAPGTDFVEDSFSTHLGLGDSFRTIQVHYIQADLLLCSPVPNGPAALPVHSPEVGDPCSQVENKPCHMLLSLSPQEH